MLHLGDYIYEGGISASGVRRHNSGEIRDLAAYRNRYGLYKGDPALQAAHAACPWIVTWDDHEVENNYADLVAQDPAEVPDFAARRAAAYQAWWEHMPVRLLPPTGPDLPIYRPFDWGTLARFHVVDTRQYRDPQACGGSLGPTCPDRTAPGRTLLGPDQEAWLGAGLAESPATWDVLANQIVMTSMPFAGQLYNPDQWDGYAAARARVLAAAWPRPGRQPRRALGRHPRRRASPTSSTRTPTARPSTVAAGTELVGGSISSTFDPALADVAEQLILQLPHVRFADTHQRGYMVCDVTPAEMVTRYQVAESTLVPLLAGHHRRHLGHRRPAPRACSRPEADGAAATGRRLPGHVRRAADVAEHAGDGRPRGPRPSSRSSVRPAEAPRDPDQRPVDVLLLGGGAAGSAPRRGPRRPPRATGPPAGLAERRERGRRALERADDVARVPGRPRSLDTQRCTARARAGSPRSSAT